MNGNNDDDYKVDSNENDKNIALGPTNENNGNHQANNVKDRRTDPFAPRPGRHLQWRNVCMTVETTRSDGQSGLDDDNGKKDHTNNNNLHERKNDNNNKHQKVILDNVWGEVPQGRMTAILGPSGSGKTSLLNVLCGRVASMPSSSIMSASTANASSFQECLSKRRSASVHVTADVHLDNVVMDPTDIRVRRRAMMAHVAQDDALQATATVREAIFFSAKLRLDTSYSDEELHALVHGMMQELGLMDCADTIIGGPLLKGVSGGERKRTSVGVELVTHPALVFLDEPTSGLDSYSARQLCRVLQKVAAAGYLGPLYHSSTIVGNCTNLF